LRRKAAKPSKARSQARASRDAQTQRAGDRELNAFISGPAAFVGGVPLTRAMNPWAMPELSTKRPQIFPCELIPLSDVKVVPGKSKVKKLFGGTKKSP